MPAMSDSEPTPSAKPQKRGPDQSWESWIDEIIREAQARGEFDNLPGAGKPLPPRRNPFLPEDQQIAFDLIQNSGYTLPWIEDSQEIDRRIARARQQLARQHQWLASERRLPTGSPERLHELDEIWTRDCTVFANDVAAINRLIDTYNLKAPSARFHKLRLIVADEISRLGDA